jgi:hypothetical protein
MKRNIYRLFLGIIKAFKLPWHAKPKCGHNIHILNRTPFLTCPPQFCRQASFSVEGRLRGAG